MTEEVSLTGDRRFVYNFILEGFSSFASKSSSPVFIRAALTDSCHSLWDQHKSGLKSVKTNIWNLSKQCSLCLYKCESQRGHRPKDQIFELCGFCKAPHSIHQRDCCVKTVEVKTCDLSGVQTRGWMRDMDSSWYVLCSCGKGVSYVRVTLFCTGEASQWDQTWTVWWTWSYCFALFPLSDDSQCVSVHVAWACVCGLGPFEHMISFPRLFPLSLVFASSTTTSSSVRAGERYQHATVSFLIFSPPPSAPAVGHGGTGALPEVHGAALLSKCPCRALCLWCHLSCQLQWTHFLDWRVQAELPWSGNPQVTTSALCTRAAAHSCRG